MMTQFRAHTTGTQSLPSTTFPTVTVLEFGTEVFDTDNVLASNVFTVPAAWNGRLGEISAGLSVSTSEQWGRLHIQRSTDGGSNWSTIRRARIQYDAGNYPLSMTIHSGVLVFATGDQYRIAYDGPAATKDANAQYAQEANFFAGCVYPTAGQFTHFRAELAASGGQNLPADTYTTLQLTEVADPEAAFASNIFTVPSALNGAYMTLTGGIDLDSAVEGIVAIARSQDSGSSWEWIARRGHRFCQASAVHSGVLQLATGEQFKLEYLNDDTFADTALALPGTHLAGMIWT